MSQYLNSSPAVMKTKASSVWVSFEIEYEVWRRVLVQVLRFVQEWSSLSAMKQKLLRRSGLLFHSPIFALQQQAATKRSHVSTKR